MGAFGTFISRRHFIGIVAQGVGTVALAQERRHLRAGRSSFRIALGSCLSNSADASILDRVVEADPQLFLWLGDNIYGDTQDMSVLRQRYQVLGNNPRFQRLWNRCPYLAIWDDHDYGQNNAGSEYPKKEESRQIFLDFWRVPANDPRRSRPGNYGSAFFGEGDRSVHVILLDGRSFRTTDKFDPNGTMLGEDQWRWLEAEIQRPSAVKVIASGIQVVPTEHGFEGWNEFPRERQRLFDIIRKHRVPGVVFASGDQHWAEISKLNGALGYPAYDLTASSLDQSWPAPHNSLRVGRASNDPSFGMIIMEWEAPVPFLRFQIISARGQIIEDQSIPIASLKSP